MGGYDRVGKKLGHLGRGGEDGSGPKCGGFEELLEELSRSEAAMMDKGGIVMEPAGESSARDSEAGGDFGERVVGLAKEEVEGLGLKG